MERSEKISLNCFACLRYVPYNSHSFWYIRTNLDSFTFMMAKTCQGRWLQQLLKLFLPFHRSTNGSTVVVVFWAQPDIGEGKNRKLSDSAFLRTRTPRDFIDIACVRVCVRAGGWVCAKGRDREWRTENVGERENERERERERSMLKWKKHFKTTEMPWMLKFMQWFFHNTFFQYFRPLFKTSEPCKQN